MRADGCTWEEVTWKRPACPPSRLLTSPYVHPIQLRARPAAPGQVKPWGLCSWQQGDWHWTGGVLVMGLDGAAFM